MSNIFFAVAFYGRTHMLFSSIISEKESRRAIKVLRDRSRLFPWRNSNHKNIYSYLQMQRWAEFVRFVAVCIQAPKYTRENKLISLKGFLSLRAPFWT